MYVYFHAYRYNTLECLLKNISPSMSHSACSLSEAGCMGSASWPPKIANRYERKFFKLLKTEVKRMNT